MRKILSTWGMILLMLVSIVGTVAAQSGVEPTATPTAVPTSQPAEPTYYQHPIVQILGAYFGRETRPTLPTPTLTPTETSTVNPSETPSVTPTETPTVTPTMGPEEFAEQIAMYHEDGMGFGVLVKLYAMAEASLDACLKQQVKTATATEVAGTEEPACVAVTVDELVNEFKSGSGMGQLFKEFGKPALLGVGQVKKALNHQPQITPTPTASGSTLQNQNQKPNNGKGNGNGNGNNPTKETTPKPHGKNK